MFQIINRSAEILKVDIDNEGSTEIAGRSRGTPRIANRILRRTRDYAQVKANGLITKKWLRNHLNHWVLITMDWTIWTDKF
ncbi:MAG: hypothetical protein CM1200mP10_05220 [Candidatus Neomarinimicrobiota bacterium]|nr:MAG: hypothetical protein CM1200mP10_05220 [Candidatus Neomarinimicrobiota bacterium]